MNFRVNLTMRSGDATSSKVVDGNTVFAMIAECAVGRSSDNVSFRVHTLTETEIEVSYVHNMAHLFGLKTAEGAPSYGWHYIITPCIYDPQEDKDLTTLYKVLWALCLTHPHLCEDKVAAELGIETEAAYILALTTPTP